MLPPLHEMPEEIKATNKTKVAAAKIEMRVQNHPPPQIALNPLLQKTSSSRRTVLKCGRATLDYLEWIKNRMVKELDLDHNEVVTTAVLCTICYYSFPSNPMHERI